MPGRKVASALLMLAAAALVTVYTVMRTTSEPDTEASTGSSGDLIGFGGALPVNSSHVLSIEEAVEIAKSIIEQF